MPHVLPFHYYLYSEVQHYQTGLRARGSEYPAQKNLYTIEEVECFSHTQQRWGGYWDRRGPYQWATQPCSIRPERLSLSRASINTHPQKHSPRHDTSALLRAYQKYTPSKKPTNVRKAAEPLSVRELSFWQIRH